MRTLTRAETVVALAETWRDVVDTISKRGPGEGGPMRMSREYAEGSYAEFERAMGVLREARRSQWWHFNERYIASSRKPQSVRYIGGRPVLRTHTAVLRGWLEGDRGQRGRQGEEQRVVETWAPAVRLEKVRSAVEFLAGEMRPPVQLPPTIFALYTGWESKRAA